jgi:hypothetical protein
MNAEQGNQLHLQCSPLHHAAVSEDERNACTLKQIELYVRFAAETLRHARQLIATSTLSALP